MVMDRSYYLAGEGRFSGSGFDFLGDQNKNNIDDLCRRVIPAVSEWGLTVLALLLLGIEICHARK